MITVGALGFVSLPAKPRAKITTSVMHPHQQGLLKARIAFTSIHGCFSYRIYVPSYPATDQPVIQYVNFPILDSNGDPSVAKYMVWYFGSGYSGLEDEKRHLP